MKVFPAQSPSIDSTDYKLAPSGTRARCLAGFDLDPTKKDGLTFGDRHHLRLRATLRDDSGAVISSKPVKVEGQSDVRAMMEAAQMEAFDEDLFNEVSQLSNDHVLALLIVLALKIRFAAARIPKNEIDPQCVSFPVADKILSFELVGSTTWRKPYMANTNVV